MQGLLVDIRRAATPTGRAGVGCFSIEGTRLHERALAAGAPLQAVVVGESWRASASERIQKLVAGLESCGCAVHVAPDDQLAELTEGREIGAVLGLVRLPEPPELVGLPGVLLVAVDVKDPGNVGALVRTAHASGAAGLVSVGISDPYHPRASRISMGSLFRIPLQHYSTLELLLADLAAQGVQTVAAVSSGGTSLPEVHFRSPVAVLMGGEAFGLPVEARVAVEQRVTIPMGDAVDSYSVNAAAAVLLYEFRRQHG